MAHDKIIAEKLGLTKLELAEYITLHKEATTQPSCARRNQRLQDLTMIVYFKLLKHGRYKKTPEDMNFLNANYGLSRADDNIPKMYDVKLLYAHLNELDDLMKELAA